MGKIKTREGTHNIKVIDKAANVSDHMRDTFVRTKDTMRNLSDDGQVSPSEYADDQLKYASEDAVHGAGKTVNKTTRKAVEKGRDAIQKRKQSKGEAEQPGSPKNSEPQRVTSEDAPVKKSKQEFAKRQKKEQVQKGIDARKQSVRTKDSVKRTVKQTGKSTGKASVKTSKATVKSSKRAVKTTEKTTKAAIKTADKTAKATKEAAKASVKTAQKAAQAAKAAGKATVASAKAVAKAVAAAVKAIIAGTKALVAAIAAGGWVAVVAIIIVCLIALIVGSCFGIFFSNEETPGGTPMTQVISQLNTEYYDKIKQIKSEGNYDDIEIVSSDGIQAVKWNEVLAVYSVKVTTNGEGADVVTITDDKIETLRQTLWDMNSITHSSKTTSKEIDVVETDADGKETTVKKTISETVWTINLTHKSYTEMIAEYGFNAEQTEQLNEMMSSEYDTMWAQLLGGYSTGTGEIIISNSEHIPKDIFAWALPESYTITSPFGYRSDPFTGKTKFHGGT